MKVHGASPAEQDISRINGRPSGVPPPGKMGASRNELWAIVLAVAILVLIGVAFWFESTH